MAYEVIARKWRPQTFNEVVGQEAITQTLRNAVAQERLHHAYLFTGARGVGKTTTARILAKSLNCALGVTPEPDNTCDSCREITVGNSMDVMEIDAASHTGVDNIRDTIINSVGIAPARDRYKVFIIDEVHQLSTAAFNALLKTLEEPPPRVVFVLATTELHKVPDTITSRCQVFEFRTINLTKVQAKLGEIAASMGVTASPAALAVIARAGEGSMRDAQSALDQVIAFAGDTIDTADVTTALGIVGDEVIYEFFDAIAEGNTPSVLRLSKRLVEGGHDLRNFARSMMRGARNLLVTRAVGYDEELVDAAEGDAKRVSDLAARFGEAELVRAFAMLSELEQEIRLSADPRFQLEIGMVRLAELTRLRPLDEILDRLTKLEAKLTSGGFSGPGGKGPGSDDWGSGSGGRGPAAPLPSRAKSAPPSQAAPSAPSEPPAPSTSAASAPQRAVAESAPSPRHQGSGPEEPPPFDDEPPFEVAPALERAPARPAPSPRAAAPKPPPEPPAAAVAGLPAGIARGLDGDAAADAVKRAVEGAGKMLLLGALESATEVVVDATRLVVRFVDPSNRLRTTVEKPDSKAMLEAFASEITNRPIRLSVVTGETPVERVATPAPLPAPTPPEPVAAEEPVEAAAEDEDPAAANPIVREVLDLFRGQIVSVEKPS